MHFWKYAQRNTRLIMDANGKIVVTVFFRIPFVIYHLGEDVDTEPKWYAANSEEYRKLQRMTARQLLAALTVRELTQEQDDD